MNIAKIISHVCLGGVVAGFLLFPVSCAAAQDNLSLKIRTAPYSEEELDDFFGTLPRYFDLGSFTLNQLNNFPIPTFTDSGMIVSGKDTAYLMRYPWKALEASLTRRLEKQQGDWGLYIKDLNTGNVMEINEHSMDSASLIKLYIAGTTLELIEKGELTETDTITSALHEMITVSDNESSNILVRSFIKEGEEFQKGLDIVNAFNQEYGFTNTEQVNGIADPSLWVSDGRHNVTSPADCGHFLEMVYNRELVSHYASYRLEDLLNHQEVNYKIPSALPEGTWISHKTGEVDDTENDAAIIYTPQGDYIFCIMSTDLYDTGSAVDTIREITKTVYDWFTKPIIELDPVTLEPLLE
ncbi:MAG: serine hydrolase [Muricoprocola sp.]